MQKIPVAGISSCSSAQHLLGSGQGCACWANWWHRARGGFVFRWRERRTRLQEENEIDDVSLSTPLRKRCQSADWDGSEGESLLLLCLPAKVEPREGREGFLTYYRQTDVRGSRPCCWASADLEELEDSTLAPPVKAYLDYNSNNLPSLLEKEMATHSSILAWRIPWTEEPGRLQSRGC